MSDKAKWAGIYLIGSSIPFFFYFFPPLKPDSFGHGVVTTILIYVPIAGLGLIALLGWRINQTRIFWSTLLVLGFYFFLLSTTSAKILDPEKSGILQTVSVAYPLAFSVIYLMKESRLWTDFSLTRVLLALFPLILFYFLFLWGHDMWYKAFFWGHSSSLPNFTLPKLTWPSLGLFLLVGAYLYDPKVKLFLVAQMVSFVPFLLAIQATLSGIPPTATIHPRFQVIVCFTVLTLVLLHALLRMYWQKIYLDPLTAVSNRQALDERLHTLNGEFSLAMVDIDHFKKFNDTYGHAEGDNVLRMVAQHLLEKLGDRVYRYGGEEFCVVFERISNDHAFELMDRTRSTLEKRRFVLRGQRPEGYTGIKLPFSKDEKRGKRVHITVSVGFAFSTKTRKTAEEVIKRADHALYEAKEKGRNRVVSAG
jgi:diguanylate cyclase (GGDEF)-like protein